MKIDRAIEEIRKGNFVLIHDASEREDETDMILAAEKVKPDHVAMMRRDGGGLICVAIHPKSAENLKLPFISDIYKSASSEFEILNSAEANDIPYGERSSFSISVNHRDTFTGITDRDRALTIRELGKMSGSAFNGASTDEFGKKFRTPGHVPILRAAENLLKDRKGHTEYSIALMMMAGVSPASVVCEMMDSETKRAMDEDKVRRYAEENDLVYIEGEEILKSYENRKGESGGEEKWRVSG